MALATLSLTQNHRWLPIGTGVSAGSSAQPQNPNQDFYPLDETRDWSFKALGSYDLPWQLRFGAVFNSLAGAPSYRTIQFTGVPQLGTVTVPAEEFGAQRNPSINLLNLKVSRQVQDAARHHVGLVARGVQCVEHQRGDDDQLCDGPDLRRGERDYAARHRANRRQLEVLSHHVIEGLSCVS